jgi:dolichyl-phosphate beta-glucosyltransferase
VSTPSAVAFSIVIPAYNEAGRLPQNLAAVAACCERLASRWGGYEVLIMVEKSTDGTLEKTRAAAIPYPRLEAVDNGVQRGKGHAVRNGMLRAAGEIIFFMDADLSTPLEAVGRFLEEFAARPEADALIGNRRHPASRIGQPQGPLRRGLSAVYSALVRRLVLPDGAGADTQCGFKAFRRRAAREIFSRQQLDGFSFDVEALFLASALGFRVADLPVEWSDAASTKLRVWQDGWAMLRDVWRVRALVARTLREQPAGSPQPAAH